MSENPIFSYTKRDYESSRQEGLAKIPILSRGSWTDLNATDPGVIILDYVHALVDMINYYQDHQALESFISTAKERANIFRLAKQLSYDIKSAKGAKCEVVFRLPSLLTYNHPIKIPQYTVVSTNSNIKYFTLEDAYLPAGQSSVSVVCRQGIMNTATYQGTGISRFSNVEGAVNQSLKLVGNIDIDTIRIVDNIGRIWDPVEYIVFSTDADRVYQVELNPDNSVTIKFGDGERGIVPKDTDTFTISYITTLGEEGRVEANAINGLDSSIYSDKGRYVDFTVYNPNPSTGGSSVQTSQEIRELAPGAIKAQDRAVTLNDFENLARLVDGVADAKAYDINVAPDLCLYHEVKVLITPEDMDGDTSLLEKDVYDYLYKRMIPPTNLQIIIPNYQYVDINLTVLKMGNAVDVGAVEYSIRSTVEEYFAGRTNAIGSPFYTSDLISRVQNISSVQSIISMTPNDTVYTGKMSVLRLGTLNISIV